LLFAAAVFLVAPIAAHAASVLVSIPIASTGVSSANSRDNNYVYEITTDPSINPGIVQSPAPPNTTYGGSAYVLDANAWPVTNGGYYSMPNGAKWIGPAPQYYRAPGGRRFLTAPPESYYVYQTSFTIADNVDLSTVLIWGSIASDNCTLSIGINGTAVSAPGQTLMVPGTCMGSGHPFEVGGSNASFGNPFGTDPVYLATAAFHNGVNTIQFKVWNNSEAPPNPTGLVVWLQAQGMETPEASTAGLLFAGLAAVAWLRRRRLQSPA
jgi:hypothetical protein